MPFLVARQGNRSKPMFALMVTVGALFVAVVAVTIINPWPSAAAGDDDHLHTMDSVLLVV